MFCPACGKEIPDGSGFCLHCGKPISAQATVQRRTSKNWPVYLIALLVGIVLLVFLASRLNREATPTRSRTENSVPAPVLQPVTERLFSGQSVVRAGKYIFVKFRVDPTTMQSAHVVCSFHASGGSGNDIQGVLAEESEFENWTNGHRARVLYSTDKVTNGKFDVPITQTGTYYLAFSNMFSLLSDKDVFAEAELRYLARR